MAMGKARGLVSLVARGARSCRSCSRSRSRGGASSSLLYGMAGGYGVLCALYVRLIVVADWEQARRTRALRDAGRQGGGAADEGGAGDGRRKCLKIMGR